ncbi:MAG: hypothetical protein M3Y31_03665, partial [Gemmatimonadota bacterium]|nr:hypothetical protein [Gemmatimonadota bacterium]
MRPNRAPVRTSYLPLLMAAVVIVGCDADVPSGPTADVAAPPAAAKPGVEPVCHFDPLAGGFVRLDVPAPGAAAHRGHGDAAPGELVPGSVGFIFDDGCQPEEIAIAQLEQLTPIVATYEAHPFTGSGEGEVTGNVIVVDINLTGDRSNTSGCEASDFAGIDLSGSNDIVLIQRSGCLFALTASNAELAGAE